MNIGDNATEFTLRDGDGNDWTLSDHRGKTVVLLFYPGDNTPVCTKQLCSVRDHWSEYQATGAEVVGISTDTVESHDKFAEKHSLPLRLLSDPDGKVSAQYGMKSWLPGRSARGGTAWPCRNRSGQRSRSNLRGGHTTRCPRGSRP